MMQAADSLSSRAPSRISFSPPDPVIALVHAHRVAIDILESLPMEGETTKAAEAGEKAIFDALLACRPATLTGAAYLCRYMAEESPSLATYGPDGGAPVAIRMLADTLAALDAIEPRSIAPDAGLKVLANDLEQLWIKEREASDVQIRTGIEGGVDAAVAVSSEVVDRILATPATTWEGLRVKARAILWCSSGDMAEALDQATTGATNERLAWSIVADLLRDQPPPPPHIKVEARS